MDPYGEDEICTRLRTALDINELRDPKSKGVEFEVDEGEVRPLNLEGDEGEEPHTNLLNSFEKSKVANSICLLSDGEDDGEEDEAEYLTDKEKLQRHLLKLPNSDITPTQDKGVLKEVKQQGIGGLIPEGALVCFHYNAYLDVGQPPFDSTRLRNEYKKLRLGKGQMIHGLEIALLSMKKHEAARFLVHHSWAYGEQGCPPRIPKATDIIYDVEVMYFVAQEGVDDYASMTEEERRRLNYSDISKVVKTLKDEANEFFKRSEFYKALNKYRKTEEILTRYNLKNDAEEAQWTKDMLKAYSNCAVCSHKCHQYGRVITYCNHALRIDRNWVKAHYLKGKALHSLSSLEDAKKSLKEAQRLTPNDRMITKALDSLNKAMEDHRRFERDFCSKMFTKPGAVSEPSTTSRPVEEPDENSVYGPCSEEFRALTQEYLTAFSKDPDRGEMAFPNHAISPAEINCILEAAVDLGMDVREKGTGNSTRYEVFKKPKKI